MPFDLKQAAMSPAHNDGTFMAFKDEAGNPITDDTKAQQGVFLRSRLSRAAMQASREAAERRIARQKEGRTSSFGDADDENTDMLVACTVNWTFIQLDGETFGFSPENARKFWTDDRFLYHRLAALQFISSDANFTRR